MSKSKNKNVRCDCCQMEAKKKFYIIEDDESKHELDVCNSCFEYLELDREYKEAMEENKILKTKYKRLLKSIPA